MRGLLEETRSTGPGKRAYGSEPGPSKRIASGPGPSNPQSLDEGEAM